MIQRLISRLKGDQPKNNVGNSTTRDFLPAALEILETPPSPIGRWLGYSLMALFAIAILWAFIGKVDIVATAEGKIIPGGRVKVIQPLQMGVIKHIYVKEGERVEQGQPLIELDQTLTGADRTRLQSELRYTKASLNREKVLQALFDLNDSAEQGRATQEVNLSLITTKLAEQNTDAGSIVGQSMIVLQQWLAHRDALSINQSRIESKQADLEVSKANIDRYTATLPLVNKRVAANEKLHSQGISAEAVLLELQEQYVSQQQALIAEKANFKRLQSELNELQQTRIAQKNAARLESLEKIETYAQQQASLEQDLQKATELNGKQILTAPVTGRIKQLAVHTVGGVVEPAKPLMQIVPEEDFLEVEAVLENKDIGFVHKGQKAEIKVHTFPFTKYGVIDAEVLDITADAIQNEQRGLVYSVRLKLDKNKLWVDKRLIDLIPGMAVTAEVKTNKRRLIEFFMSPLLRYKDESVRER